MPKREGSTARVPEYSHTQRGNLRPLLLSMAVCFLAVAYFTRDEAALMSVFSAAAVVGVILSLALGTLTVRDDGDRLAVRFGPLPLFTKAIPYAWITEVEKHRSTFLAGWGIHYTRKGWLWNIGGFDCVLIKMGEKSTLIGTDDPDGLVAFLLSRIAKSS